MDSGSPDRRLLASGGGSRADETGRPARLVKGAFASLIGPKPKVGTQVREAARYQLGPGHLGLIVTEVTVWLPGLLLEKEI